MQMLSSHFPISEQLHPNPLIDNVQKLRRLEKSRTAKLGPLVLHKVEHVACQDAKQLHHSTAQVETDRQRERESGGKGEGGEIKGEGVEQWATREKAATHTHIRF